MQLVAEGARDKLEELRRAVERGPRMAHVERVDVQWSSATGGLHGFDLGW